MNAFIPDMERASEAFRQYEIETRGWMKLLIPYIARYDTDQHLSFTELCALMWLDNVQRYLELHEAGIEMLAIPYPSWIRVEQQ